MIMAADSTAANGAGIKAGRLERADYERNFADVKPPLTPAAALVEAARCHFCFDAPCVAACPTGIDIPQFIAKISTGNLTGAAVEIFDENIFGGACARVCPTEILCEQACVRVTQEDRPVDIGRLQRHATDFLMHRSADTGGHPFERAAATGRRVAVVGAGPAGIACAHALSRRGHDIVVFDGRAKPGGLNEYGIAAYKVPEDFAGRELEFILGLGGIELRFGRTLGQEVGLDELRDEFDAVFLGLGLSAARDLDIEGSGLDGVIPAVDAIAALRQAADPATLPVGDRIVVIGGGNTAIDMAVQSKLLGAREVTIAYRRGAQEMGATGHEQELAQVTGVAIRHWALPLRIVGEAGRVTGIELERAEPDGKGGAAGTGIVDRLEADIVFTAIGQALALGDAAIDCEGGRIIVGADMQTSVAGVFAGGDCVKSGQDLTVQAVQDGKIAAAAIDRYLAQQE